MRWGIVTFPGSLDERDTAYAIDKILGDPVVSLWHKHRGLGGADCVVLPGGFSYGDYLRPGAIARFAPIMDTVVRFAESGGLVMGICNGFQTLCEAGLLPGALIRNNSLTFLCKTVNVRVEQKDTPFTAACELGERLALPIKHGAGCFVADRDTLERIETERQVILRYVDAAGRVTDTANPNGSLNNIAGIVNVGRNVFGLMPHPEHACERLLGSDDGARIFRSIKAAFTGRAASDSSSAGAGG
jgi:phosphoribosylformylglycinamidine synthase subunit PurQ / glutaminase